MSDSLKHELIQRLEQAGQKIAPSWADHYKTHIPPEFIINYFDDTVAEIIKTETNINTVFGLEIDDVDGLKSALLDIVIDAARRGVKTIQQENIASTSTTSEYRQNRIQILRENIQRRKALEQQRIEEEKQAVLERVEEEKRLLARLAGEALIRQQDKERTTQIHLQQMQEAAIAERNYQERLNSEIAQLIKHFPEICEKDGAVTHKFFFEILINLTRAIVKAWPSHGGQRIDDILRKSIKRVIRALLTSVDLETGSWDYKGQNGEIVRDENNEALINTQTDLFLKKLAVEATPHFTYALQSPWTPNELETYTFDAIKHAINEEIAEKNTNIELQLAAEKLVTWQELHEPPPPCKYGVSPIGAEKWCMEWLNYMGLKNASLTQQSGDGGIDISSETHIAQVKHYSGPVPISEIREFAGVAAIDGRIPIFFTSGAYPTQATDFAEKANMHLFVYDVISGNVSANNALAERASVIGFL